MLIIASHFCCFVSIYLLFHLCKSLCAACCMEAAVQIKLIDGLIDYFCSFSNGQTGATAEALSHSRSVCWRCRPGAEQILRENRRPSELGWACDSDWSIISQIPIRSLIKAACRHMQWNRSSFLAAWGQKCRSTAQSGISNDGISFFFSEKGGNKKVKGLKEHFSRTSPCFLMKL